MSEKSREEDSWRRILSPEAQGALSEVTLLLVSSGAAQKYHKHLIVEDHIEQGSDSVSDALSAEVE
jgi:hypothetical protein